MLRAACVSIAIILGLATLAIADDARVLDKPITAEERDHWAFRPPVRPEPPAVKNRNWVRNPIDAFIMAGLEVNGLSPAPEAGRTTLLRRLSAGALSHRTGEALIGEDPDLDRPIAARLGGKARLRRG